MVLQLTGTRKADFMPIGHYKRTAYHNRKISEGLPDWTKNMRKVQSKNCSRNLKKLWKDPEYRERRIKSLHAGVRRRWKRKSEHKAASRQMKKQIVGWREDGLLNVRPSKPQKSLLRKLCRAGIKGFKLEVPFERYSLDVANAKLKICVELDGTYWHSINPTDYDRRDRKLRKLDWRLKRFGTSELEVSKALMWVQKQLEK